jgi:hypothetical protein
MKLSGTLHPSVLDTSLKCARMQITGWGMKAIHRSSFLSPSKCGLCFNFCRGKSFLTWSCAPHTSAFAQTFRTSSSKCPWHLLSMWTHADHRLRHESNSQVKFLTPSKCGLCFNLCRGGNPSQLDHVPHTLQHSMKLSGHLHPSVLDTSLKCERMRITGWGMRAIHRSSFLSPSKCGLCFNFCRGEILPNLIMCPTHFSIRWNSQELFIQVFLTPPWNVQGCGSQVEAWMQFNFSGRPKSLVGSSLLELSCTKIAFTPKPLSRFLSDDQSIRIKA